MSVTLKSSSERRPHIAGLYLGAGLIKKTQVTFFDRLGAATHSARSEAHTKMEALLSYPKISDRRECSR